jgi:hypothetical protein
VEKKGGGMIIRMDMEEQQFEELENLAVIFEGCFSDGEKVQCFDFLKEIAENKYDMEKIPQDMKEKMRMQMIDAFEWLECLNVKIKYKDEFLAYFASDSGQSDFLSIT